MHAGRIRNRRRPNGVRADGGEAGRCEEEARVEHEDKRIAARVETPPTREAPEVGGARRKRERARRDAFGRDDPERERKARERHDGAVRLAERDRPHAGARIRQPVAGEARRHPPADQEDQHDDEAERRARRNLGEAEARVLDMERDVDEREGQDERGHFHVAPIPPGADFARDERGEDDQEGSVDRRGGGTADRR